MVHFEQRPLWPPIAVLSVAATIGPVTYGLVTAPDFTLHMWYAMGPLAWLGWYSWHSMGAHAHSALRVDDDGVWVDEVLAVPAGRITAVTVAGDVQGLGSSGGLRPRQGRSWWSLRQDDWLRVLHLDGIGPVVLSRDRDLARGSQFDAVVVVTDDLDEGCPAAWALPTLRLEELGTAVLHVAPDAVVAVTAGR